MNYNAGEPTHVRGAKKQAELVERKRREIISGIMSTASGRSWVLDFMDTCNMFTVHEPPFDPINVAFREGQRHIGMRLLNDIMSACPDHYITMMQERSERDASRDSSRTRKPDPDDPDPNPSGGNGRDDDDNWVRYDSEPPQ
jgi:hypothetical protein